jgi:hypothetical protein
LAAVFFFGAAFLVAFFFAAMIFYFPISEVKQIREGTIAHHASPTISKS